MRDCPASVIKTLYHNNYVQWVDSQPAHPEDHFFDLKHSELISNTVPTM